MQDWVVFPEAGTSCAGQPRRAVLHKASKDILHLLGRLLWGSHSCAFLQSAAEILVYLDSGVRRGTCRWHWENRYVPWVPVTELWPCASSSNAWGVQHQMQSWGSGVPPCRVWPCWLPWEGNYSWLCSNPQPLEGAVRSRPQLLVVFSGLNRKNAHEFDLNATPWKARSDLSVGLDYSKF